MVSARELNVEGVRCRGDATRGVRNVVRLEASLVSPVNFLAENGVFSSGILLIVTVLICGCHGCGSSFSCLFAPVFRFLPVACVPTSFLDARVTRMGQ